MVESQLGELKTSLAGANLKADSIQVSVANESSSDFDERREERQASSRDFSEESEKWNRKNNRRDEQEHAA